MKVVIVGASYTGIQLARSLADEKSDVVLIDNSPEKVRLARNKIDCTVIQAAGNDLQVLERDAGISSAGGADVPFHPLLRRRLLRPRVRLVWPDGELRRDSVRAKMVVFFCNDSRQA